MRGQNKNLRSAFRRPKPYCRAPTQESPIVAQVVTELRVLNESSCLMAGRKHSMKPNIHAACNMLRSALRSGEERSLTTKYAALGVFTPPANTSYCRHAGYFANADAGCN